MWGTWQHDDTKWLDHSHKAPRYRVTRTSHLFLMKDLEQDFKFKTYIRSEAQTTPTPIIWLSSSNLLSYVFIEPNYHATTSKQCTTIPLTNLQFQKRCAPAGYRTSHSFRLEVVRLPLVILKSSELTFWRPTNIDNKLVTTQNLQEHCEALRIPMPGCLCPLEDANLGPFVEAIISFGTCSGSYDQEYVAECSTGLCGYSGKHICN